MPNITNIPKCFEYLRYHVINVVLSDLDLLTPFYLVQNSNIPTSGQPHRLKTGHEGAPAADSPRAPLVRVPTPKSIPGPQYPPNHYPQQRSLPVVAPVSLVASQPIPGLVPTPRYLSTSASSTKLASPDAEQKESSSLNSADLKRPLPGKKKNYVIAKFADLPEEYQKHVIKAGITLEEAAAHLEIVLNILHFKTKCDFHTPEQLERKNVRVRRYNTGESLIADGIVSTAELHEEALELLEREYSKKDYKMLHQAGKGGFGKVYLAKSYIDRGIHVAVKRMPHVTVKQKRKNFQEIRFLVFCAPSRNVVQYFRSYLVKEEIWLVTEFMQGGTLTQAVSHHRFLEPEIAYIAKQVLIALEFLHKNQLAHRDLKSANIMIDLNGVVKIIDFGLCSDISQGEVVHMVGSPFWMPPEMIKREPHGLAVDIWSFAICLMEVANGHPPNRRSSIKAMFTAGTVGYPQPLEHSDRWSDHFKDFLNGCLRVDPSQRRTVKQLLQHPFLNQTSSTLHMQDLFKRIFFASQSANSADD